MSGEPWPDYGQQDWDADNEEIRRPPTTHFVATVDDLTDMLDFGSEDIDGMDDDVGDEHEPAPIGYWEATSSHDIYMVDTPNEGNGDEIAEDDPSRSKQSVGIGAAQNPASAKTTITAQEKITPLSTPEETTTTLT